MKIKTTPNTLEWSIGKVSGFSEKRFIELAGGNFKMVKVGPSSSYPKHMHWDKTEFAFILSGSVILNIGDKNYHAKEGEFYTFPVSVKHSIENISKSDSILLIGSINE